MVQPLNPEPAVVNPRKVDGLVDTSQIKDSIQFSRVVIVRTDVRRQDFPTQEAYIADLECIARSEQVAKILIGMGVPTQVIVANTKITDTLSKIKPDLCINFVDSIRGSGQIASGIPGIFELLRIPYVGAGTLGLALSNNKYLTKALLEAWEIPTPQYQLFRNPKQPLEYDIRYPLIVKLNEEHGSVGIDQDSVVTNDRELRERLRYLIGIYKQPALVEEFIENAVELTGVVLEANKTVKVFLSERTYDAPKTGFKLLTFDTKWATDLGHEEPVTYKPFTRGNNSLIRSIKEDLRTAFEVTKMDDLGRFDIMLDKYDNYYIIDSNANPALGPETAVAYAAKVNGHRFTTILLNILQRNKQDLLHTNGVSPNYQISI